MGVGGGGGGGVAILPADRYKNFLQGTNIILGVCKQACPKYPE